MYIKSILELEKAYAEAKDINGHCVVKCTTTGTMSHKTDGPDVKMEYTIANSILLPCRVVKEFIETKCHYLISNTTMFSVTEDMAIEFVVDIFKKVHIGYLELIACRAKHIEREYIFPALQAEKEAATPPNSPFDDFIGDIIREEITATPEIVEQEETPPRKLRRLKE